MTENDKRAFAALMETLAVLRKDPLTPTMLRVYWAVLVDLDLADVERAVVACLKVDEFFPSPSRLRGLAFPQDGTPTTRAAAVFDALCRRGPHNDYHRGDYWLPDDVEEKFGLVAREAFIAAGGTRAFQQRTEKSLPFLRKDFLAAFVEVEPLAQAGELRKTLPPGNVDAAALVKDLAAKMDANQRQLPKGDRTDAPQ